MKIFNNFDTKQNLRKSIALITEHGDGNVLIFKKHIFFLTKSLFFYLISLGGFIGVIMSLHIQFREYPILYDIFIGIAGTVFIFWSIIYFIGYVASFLGRSPISDSLDTVPCLRNRFEFFIKTSIVFFVIRIALLTTSIILEFYLPHPDEIWLYSGIYFHIFATIVYLFGVYFTVYRVIQYDMDYYCITPSFVELLYQKGFFTKQTVTLPVQRITMISVVGGGLLQSLFKYGTLSFYNDQATVDHQDFDIQFTPSPNRIKAEVNEILSKNLTF